jgi:hypothetical protein
VEELQFVCMQIKPFMQNCAQLSSVFAVPICIVLLISSGCVQRNIVCIQHLIQKFPVTRCALCKTLPLSWNMSYSDDFFHRWISVVHLSECPLHTNNRFQFNKPDNALCFDLRSLYRTEDTYHVCDTGTVLHSQGCTRTQCQRDNINSLSCA